MNDLAPTSVDDARTCDNASKLVHDPPQAHGHQGFWDSHNNTHLSLIDLQSVGAGRYGYLS
jgi:hypothetical protein